MIIRDKDRKRLVDIFSTVPSSFEVWAFGSRVDGSAHDGSDLDLVIRTSDLSKLDYSVFTTLKVKIRESNIPIVVELFDWARLPTSFQKNILELHEVLFSK
jgi:predicted nucleotidyltransferase